MSTATFSGTDTSEAIGASRPGLRARLVISAVVLVLLAVGGTGIVGWFIADQKLVQTASDRLGDAAVTFAFLYEQRIEAARSVGERIAEDIAAAIERSAAATNPPDGSVVDEAAVSGLLEPIRDLRPHYSLAITDATGHVVARSSPEGASLPTTTLFHLPGVPHALQGEEPPPAIVYQTDGLENTCALAMSVAITILDGGCSHLLS